MAANVFNTERAVHASVKVVRAFVGLRLVLASNAELSRRLDGLEGSTIVQGHVRRDPTTHVPAGSQA